MGLTRQSKLALFTRDNLVKLATLYGTLYKRENERQSKSSREVAKDILQLLHILCTDRVHSIVFPNALGYFSVRSVSLRLSMDNVIEYIHRCVLCQLFNFALIIYSIS